jgi:hypothetical protein
MVIDQGTWRVDFSTTNAYIVYGPYVRLPYGAFEVSFHLAASGIGMQPLRSLIQCDVAANTIVLNSADLIGYEGADMLREGVIRLQFFNSQPKAQFEFRIATFGGPFDGALLFSGVSLRHLGQR